MRVQERARRLRQDVRFLAELRFLPPKVALFQWRAWRLARRIRDPFSQLSATRPRKLAVLLSAARGCRTVVELGTGTAWTAISLTLADQDRVVLSYDPIKRPERERYLQLVNPATQRRLTLVGAAGNEGPRDNGIVDLLYIDSRHDRDDTMREMQVWQPVLGEGSFVVFDDYAHPDYPGVEEAVRRLGFEGEQREGLFLYRVST